MADIEKKHGAKALVRMECSPFWRCLETSSHIAKNIGHQTVTFNYDFAEWLADWLYKENPMPALASQTQDFDSINKNFKELGVSFADD